MKRILILGAVILGMTACSNELPSTGNFGEEISEEGALDVAAFMADMGDKESHEGTISGTIQKVCQEEGCWYTLALADGKTLRVMMKDHSFVLPKDASGKIAIAKGEAKVITTSVDRLKHLAKDAEKSQEEIDAITEPKQEIEFTAIGVIVKDPETSKEG